MAEAKTDVVQHRLSAEGADPLLLAGVNDSHLLELARVAGARVVLRNDQLLLSGPLAEVERTVPVAQHMIELARSGTPFAVDDIARFGEQAQVQDGGLQRLNDGARIVVPGARKTITPKTEGQREYLDDPADEDVPDPPGPELQGGDHRR